MEDSRSSAGSLASSVQRPSSAAAQHGEDKVVQINKDQSTGVVEKAAAIFKQYDTGGKGLMEHESMMSALAELGVMNGLTSKKLTEILSIGNDQGVGKGRDYTLQEFVSFYERLAHYQAKAARQDRIKALSKMSNMPEGMEGSEDLKKVFNNYCKYSVGAGARPAAEEAEAKMTSTQFVKLAQDLGLVQPNGPLNVVTVDVIFHKHKPQGGRRLTFQCYIKALTSAAEETNMNVIELCSILAEQITPQKAFVAPQPVMFRQEVRNMEKTNFKLAAEQAAPAEEPIGEYEESNITPVKPRERKALESDDESEEETPKAKKEKPAKKDKAAKAPTAEAPAKKDKAASPAEQPDGPDGPSPTLYSMGQGGKNWLATLPPDAPEWVRDMATKMNEMEQQFSSATKENYELKKQVGKVAHSIAKSRLANGSGVDYAAFEALAAASGMDTKELMTAVQSGSISGADMANLLVDVDKRLKAMESGGGNRRGIRGVNRGGAGGAGGDGAGDQSGEGGGGFEGEEDELVKKVEVIEKQLEEVTNGEKLRTELRDEMKKLAKGAATAATKNLPNLEQRVTACETKSEALEQNMTTFATAAAKVDTLDNKVKSLTDSLQKEVSAAVDIELAHNLGGELGKMLQPGGDLGKVVAANVEIAAGELAERLGRVESGSQSNNTRVATLEGLVSEHTSKVDQALAIAQDGMSRQVALAPKVATLEASNADLMMMSTSIEATLRELQQQVRDLQAKNTHLESEVEKLKTAPLPKDGRDGRDGVDGHSVVHHTTSVVEQPSTAGGRRGGAADTIAMAELTGRLMGLEGSVKDIQQGLVTALTAVGFTPTEAAKDGSAVTAASRHAAHESTISDMNTRLTSLESKQHEAAVTLRKAEAMLSGPAAGLAAMNAANAAAASAANARKEKHVDQEVVEEMNRRVTSLESRQKELSNSLTTAVSAAAALPALESAINTRLPELESLIRRQDLNNTSLSAKLPEIESLMANIRTKLPEMDTSIKVLDTRMVEQERKATNADRISRELTDRVNALQLEHESLATNAAISAQLRTAGGGGGGHSGGVDPAALQLVMSTEERLQKHIHQLKEGLNNQIADLDAAKVKYDTNLDLMQATFEQMNIRLNNMDGNTGGDSRSATYARVSDVREVENHLTDRVNMTAEQCDKMQRTINQIVADVERVANSHNSSEQARVANAGASRATGPSVGAESLQLLEQRVEARLSLLSTQYVTSESIREWEVRFATTDAVRMAQEKARANDEVILSAVKEVDRQLNEKLEVSQQVMLRMARQVDVLQNTLRNAPAPDAAASTIKVIKGGGAPLPPGAPSLTSAIPLPLARSESGKDPLSILLAQAGANTPAAIPDLPAP